MTSPRSSPADLVRNARRANAAGTDLLKIGLGVGAMGVAGAALGVVCPACVVATPALLGFGLIQKVRSWFLARRAKNRAVAPPIEQPQGQGT